MLNRPQNGGVVQNGRRTGQMKNSPNGKAQPPAAIEPFNVQKEIFSALKKKIIERAGSTCLAGFGRRFRLMDRGGQGFDDQGANAHNRKGDGKLSSYELYTGLKQVGIGVDKAGAESLLVALDKDGSGFVCFNEFITALKGGEMTPRRIAITKQAYEIICNKSATPCSKNPKCSSCANTYDYASAYDVSQNPDVLEGRKTPDEAIRDFMENFDLDGDGCVTWEEFLQYYDMISCSIDRDDYYELMMRNAWRIAGGTGAAQGTTNYQRKVRYLKDGKKYTVLLSNDLGIDLNNPKSIKAELYKRGVYSYDKLYMDNRIEC